MSGDRNNIIPFPGAPHAGEAMQFRIDLMLVAEPVWRRIVVPAGYTFWDLHVAIQDAMGGEDRHLHEFRLDDPRASGPLRFGIPDESAFHGAREVLTGWDYVIAEHFVTGLGPALYTYDFGDDWQHEISLEAMLDKFDPNGLPTCLEGEGVCPREDCGGPFAWEEILAESAAPEKFDPERVVFDNPHERWIRSFGHD